MWLGMAQAQASRQAMDLSFARGPMMNGATEILPATFDCLGSSDLMALPLYWMIAPASPPRIAAPS